MSTSPAALRRGCGFAQRLYRPHVEDIAFLFLRLTSSRRLVHVLSLSLSPPRTYVRRPRARRSPRSRRSRFLGYRSSPARTASRRPLFSRRQMRLVRFTRTRSVTRVLSAHNLGPDRSSRFVLRLLPLWPSFYFYQIDPIDSRRVSFSPRRYTHTHTRRALVREKERQVVGRASGRPTHPPLAPRRT